MRTFSSSAAEGGGIAGGAGFGTSGGAGGSLADATASASSASTVFGPAPCPCKSSTVARSSCSRSTTLRRYAATLRSS
ncbi:MAG: hypothetical protein FJW31_21795 [Acidobacteria bacterium]|nr:hypothetical protein [Acidobacteriota bacterium]